MHLKWLKKHCNRTSNGGDANDSAPKITAHAATREARRETQALRLHYRQQFKYESYQTVAKFHDRMVSVTSVFYDVDLLGYQSHIRHCCEVVSYGLLEESLIRRRSPSPTSSDEHKHVDRVRSDLCWVLFRIAKLARSFKNVERRRTLVKSFVAIAVSATTLAALDAVTTLAFEPSTMAVSHSLVAAAHQTAEYIARCEVQGKKPSRNEAKTLFLSSALRRPQGPEETQSSSVLASNSDTLLGSPEADPESTALRNPFLDRHETPSSCSSQRTSYSTESAPTGNRTEKYSGLLEHPSNMSEAAILFRGKRTRYHGVGHGRA